MNWDRIEGSWKRFRGTARAKWAGLTGERLDRVAGNRDQLAGRAQESQGLSSEAAQRHVEKRP